FPSWSPSRRMRRERESYGVKTAGEGAPSGPCAIRSGRGSSTEAGAMKSQVDGPFVGREGGRGVLRACLAAAGDGRGPALLGGGEGGGERGGGKRRGGGGAVGEATSRGFAVAIGACDPGVGTPEYWPWRAVYRALTVPAGSDSVAPTAPLLLDGVLADGPSAGGMPDQERFRLFEGAAHALVRRTRREPVLLVLEDLHWADPSSLLLLEFLPPRLRGAAVVLLATYRDLDVTPDHPLYAALAAMSRHSHTERIVLRGLEPDALARFVAETAGVIPSPAGVASMLRDTGGNPFFVSEIVRLLTNESKLERLTAAGSEPLRAPPSVRPAVRPP